MMIDRGTLLNLRTHREAWLSLLNELKELKSSPCQDMDFDTSYIDHEIRAMELTLAQADELLTSLDALGPVLRMLLAEEAE